MQEYLSWQNPDALRWLWLMPPLAVLVWLAAGWRLAALRVFLGQRYRWAEWRWHRRRRLLKGLMLSVAVGLLVVATARPRVGTEVQQVERHGADVVLVIDTSDSMLAQDVQPSRLEAAKEAALTLVRRLEGDRVGVVVFAGSAYMYSPLTIDQDAAAMFVSSIERGSAPSPGTALAGALSSAIRLLDRAEHHYKTIVLFSDGEDHPGVEMNILKEARRQGITVHVVGLGGSEGVPIPVPEQDQGEQDHSDPLGMFESMFGSRQPHGMESKFKRDQEGDVVLTSLGEKMLSDVAREGGGVFVRSSESGANVDKVHRAITSMESGVIGTYEITKYAERYQWPLGAAMLLLLLDGLIAAAPRRREGG